MIEDKPYGSEKEPCMHILFYRIPSALFRI